MDNVTTTMWDTYRVINDWIKFSDTKATALLASNGVILSIIFSKVIDNLEFIKYSYLILLSLIFGFLCGLISIYFCIRCLSPMLNIGENDSLIFFGSISKKFDTHREYEKNIMNLFSDDAQFKSQIIQQVWTNAKIASKKYDLVFKAIRSFKYMVVFMTLGGILALSLFYGADIQIPDIVYWRVCNGK